MSLHKLTVQEAQNAALGQAGYKVITTNTGDIVAGVEYVAVTIVNGADADITTVSNDTDTYPNITSMEVPNGTTVFGRWSKVTVAGTDVKAICYRG